MTDDQKTAYEALLERCRCHKEGVTHDECRLLGRCAEDTAEFRRALGRAANEGRNVLPDATDDQASVIEAWALDLLGADAAWCLGQGGAMFSRPPLSDDDQAKIAAPLGPENTGD